MKILQLIQNYYPSVGGTQIFFQKLGEKCVADYGDSVEVCTTDSYFGPDKIAYKKIEPQEEVLNGVTVRRFPFIKIHKRPFLFAQKILVRVFKKRSRFLHRYLSGPWSPSLIKAVSKTNADVIVASSFGYSYMDYGLWRNKTGNPKPFVFQGAVHFKNDESVKIVDERVLRSIHACEYYLANTEYEKQRLVKLSVEAEKIEVLGSTVDVEKFEKGKTGDYRKNLAVEANEILIAYIGRIEPAKNIDVLLNAMPAVWAANKKVVLVIAGFKNVYIDTLQKSVADIIGKNEGQKIIFLTDISEQEKINLYHAIDILVLPSVNESFGMVFLEAWACSKPVIGAGIGAVACVINNNVDGLLMQPMDAADLAEKIITLSGDKQLRQSMGQNGYVKTKQTYTVDAVTKKYRQILHNAVIKFNSNHSHN